MRIPKICVWSPKIFIKMNLSRKSLPHLPYFLIFVFISVGELHAYQYKSFVGKTTCTSMYPPLSPRTLPDLQSIIKSALIQGVKVKPIGNLDSTSDCVCTDGIPVSLSHINHFLFDPFTNLATVGAGSSLESFLQNLHKEGRALTGCPVFGGSSIGGILATGAHGTSTRFPSTLSDQLVSATIVDGLGEVRVITEEKDSELFKAIQVNLGFLGIVFEAVFRTVPQFKLQIKTFPIPEDQILGKNSSKLLEYADNNDVFSFWWFPTARQVILSVGNRVEVNTFGTCETHLFPEVSPPLSFASLLLHEQLQATRNRLGYFLLQKMAIIGLLQKIPGRTPIFTEEDGLTYCGAVATGFSHKMMSHTCKQCFWQYGASSFATEGNFIIFPKEELLPALETLRRILNQYPVEFTLQGIYFRFLTRSSAYLGLNGGRESVEMELTSVKRVQKSEPRLGLAAIQAMGQALVEKHSGRAHWAVHEKYYSNSEILQRAYPQLDKFINVMEELDPEGVFMNDLGRRIRSQGISEEAGKVKEKYCALNEDCVCESDLHCGNGGENDLQCGTLCGFKVCRGKRGSLF